MRAFIQNLAAISLVLLLPTIVSAQAVHRPSEPSDNAALQYWQAFAQLPTLDADQQKILDEWGTVSLDDPAVEKLVTSSQASLKYLRRGAKLEVCNWGLDYNDGVSMLLLHLAKARDLARVAALDARYQFAKGNKKALRDDAMSMMALSRHVGREPVMVGILVRILIEGMVIDLVSSYVPELKASYADSVAMFNTLPSSARVADCIPVEKEFFVDWMVRKLKEEEERKKGAGLVMWKNFIGPHAPQELQAVDSVDEALELLDEITPIYGNLTELIALPHAEFTAKYPQFKQRAISGNKLAEFILPEVNSLVEKERRSEARLAMLLAAIAVVDEGPEKLKEIKDPFGDGPFEYRKLDGGFELQSNLQVEGKPVTVTAGQRGKR